MPTNLLDLLDPLVMLSAVWDNLTADARNAMIATESNPEGNGDTK